MRVFFFYDKKNKKQVGVYSLSTQADPSFIEHHKDTKNQASIQIYFTKVINKKLLITTPK